MSDSAPTHRRLDPRLYQIAVLASLLAYGVLRLELPIRGDQVVAIVATALLTQWTCSRWVGLPRFDPRSPLTSALSLCLLLRAGSLGLAVAAAAITIASKFLIRARGKHVFNPTNFGLAAMMLISDEVWVSPGQWGSAAFFGFLLACLGGLVVHRAARGDVTYAFLVAYSAVLFGRAAWLGDPLAIPWHQIQSGAFLIFAFFMISDPKTTPDTRLGRILYAAAVAGVAGVVRFGLHQPNALIWALVGCAPLVPVIDRLLPGEHYRWRSGPDPSRKELTMHRLPQWSPIRGIPFLISILTAAALFAAPALAFCGFYVAKADTRLFNQASKVVIARDGDRTVITMANDYRGEPEEFALVVPVPTFLEREQIHVSDRAIIEHLDAYSAPRLVEYHDPNPCQVGYERWGAAMAPMAMAEKRRRIPGSRLGVTVEARYTVGEYDIVILSAEESEGLEIWLERNGYRVPEGASRVLGSYIRQKMRFFVAKVNLREQARLGYSYLRPLQVAFESPKFMLPVRLGTVNADGEQELFVFVLSRRGRVETTNYRTVRLPANMELPAFVKDDFSDFYRDMFARQVERENRRAVFLEYAWDMGWCDPCAADPLSERELSELGVFWIDERPHRSIKSQARDVRPGGGRRDTFVTRLHLRYTADSFPEDLFFQETGDRTNFQGRYVLRHPWRGSPSECPAAGDYFAELRRRRSREAETLASLTGWNLADIRDRMDLGGPVEAGSEVPWWKKLWSE